MVEYEGWEEEEKVGNRELPKQRCLDMDWSNPKEITAWEIARCLIEYNLNFSGQTVSRKRSKQIATEIISQRQKNIKISRQQNLETEKESFANEYLKIDISSCKKIEQIDIVRLLLEDESLREIASFLHNDFTPRDTQHYYDDLKSYIGHLEDAQTIHGKYLKNINDKEAVETVEYHFKKIIDLGLPKPFTVPEVKTDIFKNICQNLLEKAGLAPTPAEKLSKQITKIHFTR